MAVSKPYRLEVKVLDASRYKSADPAERKAYAAQLVQGLMQDGFVKIVNHGIPRSVIEEAMATSKRFFSLPDSVKRQIEHVPGPDPQRGWSRVGSESTAKLFGALKENGEVITDTDSKEHFDIGPPTDLKFPNRWLYESEVPAMKAFLEDFYERLHETSMDILAAMELGLGLSAGTFTDRCDQRASELRLNHYPEVVMEHAPREVSRVWPHYDLGIITCLFQDSVGGLEIEDRNHADRFETVDPDPASPDELILNISETFERWTNGIFKAGLHKVRLPPALERTRQTGKELVVPERYSIPFFVKASHETCVGPMDEFISEKRPPMFQPLTALEYQMQRLAKAY
ncbi:oxidoreductase [Microdochium trichocladiopsis]|uniref:Oxidoreductase n=1 Tax=Microdochium trichocladiopsis TaxID=1682393 RepID=A0A9P8XZ85_9PEZI|nr:oxidoreductase [Microdochium trichocladiopsis]KAH7025264.1 oxidoreductase [Microdochium trichocladiopsis]